ncbi:MAG: hypothetical protein L6Q68_18520 [Aquabacterium sp.]|nr:hypothetical protein [Aquabacterium sp.]
MVFVNEYIPETDYDKHDLRRVCSEHNLPNRGQVHSRSWTIDRERDAYLIKIWAHQDSEFSGWAFCWRGEWVFFEMRPVDSKHDRVSNSCWFHFIVRKVLCAAAPGDDGWLVRDLNGNGQIDSCRELFGADTQIDVAGVARNAGSGFEALAALDTNADGVFDALDAAFGQLRIWRDLNQDGLSQGGELSTLAANGITGIELTPTGGSADLGNGNGNGNSVSGRATVHRAGGLDGEIEAVAQATQAFGEARNWSGRATRPRGVPQNAFDLRPWCQTVARGHATSGAQP